ncbi:colicin V production protein [Tumebacillus sp. BK434]|uniref:CvpA family protein n=1 Tax=Tumebacillus sp. BK434 TaxID=2512169 RepID=UPI00104BE0D4|nr:CvpA family protein [Tumebacillus sp. BK434]TCP52441.1 colicin V production protein [Tumebacillus sp. BK434]
MSPIDLLFLVLLLLGLWAGFARGLLSGISRLIAYLAALFLAARFAAPIGQLAGEWLGVGRFVRSMIAGQIPESLHNAQVPPEQLRPILEAAGVPAAYREQMIEYAASHPLLEAIAIPYTEWMHTVLGLILMLGVLCAVFNLLLRPLVKIAQDFVPAVLNRAGGLLLGGVLTLFELAILALILQAFADLPQTAGLQTALSSSELLPPLTHLAQTLLTGLGTDGLLPAAIQTPPTL